MTIPDHVKWHCELCPAVSAGAEEALRHLAEEHGCHPERWPDGGLVVDASDVPELLADCN